MHAVARGHTSGSSLLRRAAAGTPPRLPVRAAAATRGCARPAPRTPAPRAPCTAKGTAVGASCRPPRCRRPGHHAGWGRALHSDAQDGEAAAAYAAATAQLDSATEADGRKVRLAEFLDRLERFGDERFGGAAADAGAAAEEAAGPFVRLKMEPAGRRRWQPRSCCARWSAAAGCIPRTCWRWWPRRRRGWRRSARCATCRARLPASASPWSGTSTPAR